MGYPAQGVEEHGAAKHADVTRELFLPIKYFPGASFASYAEFHGIRTTDGVDSSDIFFIFKVPDDFVSFTSAKIVWLSDVASGNMYWKINADYGKVGETSYNHEDDPAHGVTATAGVDILNVQEPANPLTLTNLAKGDYVGIQFARAGTNLLDTLGSEAYIFGLLFTYVAEQ